MKQVCYLMAMAAMCAGCAEMHSKAELMQLQALEAHVEDYPAFSAQLYNFRPTVHKQSNMCTINSTSVIDNQNMTVIVHPCMDVDVMRYLIAVSNPSYSNARDQLYLDQK